MVTLTETAAKKVETLRLEEGKPEWGLRLRVVGGGCSGFSYELGWEEAEQEGDQVIESAGVKVYVDPNSVQLQGQLRLRALLPGLIPVHWTASRETACGSRSRCSRDTVRR